MNYSSLNAVAQLLAPLLFADEEFLEEPELGSVVIPVEPSSTAKRKAQSLRKLESFPVQSFRTLLTNLSTICQNRVQSKLEGVSVSFSKLTSPTPWRLL